MNSPTREGPESILYTLAVRLLGYEAGPLALTQLLVGQIPEPLMLDLPLPDGSRVLGGVVYANGSAIAMFDVPLTPEAVLHFYQEHLLARVWEHLVEEEDLGLGGFTFGLERGQTMRFYRSLSNSELSISADAHEAGLSDVRLSLETKRRSKPIREMRGQWVASSLLPALTPPPQAQQVSGGGGGHSEKEANSRTTLITDLDLASVARHYTSQLERAGWVHTEEGQSGPFAWSQWRLQTESGEHWQGVFFVLKQSELPRQYFLHVQVDWVASS